MTFLFAQSMNARKSNNYKELEKWTKHEESIKSAMEQHVVKPHALDHSNKETTKSSKSWLSEHSLSSKIRWLRSHHMVHIKHRGTRFQTTEECFPNQFRQPRNRSTTRPGNNQNTPNERKTKSHNMAARGQWSNKWSTVSSLHQHIQHHPAKPYSCRIRLSHQRISLQAAHQPKKG